MPVDRKRGKGGKFKKNRKKKVYLSTEDLQYLIENTKYDEAEIAEWFRYKYEKVLNMRRIPLIRHHFGLSEVLGLPMGVPGSM